MEKVDFLLNFKMNLVNIVVEENGKELCKVVIEGKKRKVNRLI